MSTIFAGVSQVDIAIPDNVWWVDAFQFGASDDTSWSFTGKHFLCDIKVKASDTSPLLSLTSVGMQIVVDDAALRILHFNVTDIAIRAALPPTNACASPPVCPYHYDLIMVDNSSGERDMLMYGSLVVGQGVTVED